MGDSVRPEQEIGEKRGLSPMCQVHIPTRKVALSDTLTTAPHFHFASQACDTHLLIQVAGPICSTKLPVQKDKEKDK